MPLNTKTEEQFISDSVVAWANSLNLDPEVVVDPNLIPGDPLLAIMEGKTAGGDLFLQSANQQCYNYARLQTCYGADADSWCAQFNFTRLGASKASGEITFSLNAPAPQNIYIPLGTIIQTAGGAIQYALIADTNQSSFSQSQNSYVIAVGQTSITATAQALVAGTPYNVQIGQLNQFYSSVPSVNFVTNNAAITNGTDAESDANFKARFILFFNSRDKGTYNAYLEYIQSLDIGIQFINLIENQNQNGQVQYGYITIVVDDGSGATPSGKITTINQGLIGVRCGGIQVFVTPASALTASINLNVRLGPNAVGTNSQVLATAAMTNYINTLPIGATLYFNKIIQVAIDADPVNILSVETSGMTLNGGQADLIPTDLQVIRATLESVVVGTY